jgi:hypothetical protein
VSDIATHTEADTRTAWFEPTGGIIRVCGAGDDLPTFEYAVAVVGGTGTATLKALSGGIRLADRRLIADALRRAGFHTAVWDRLKRDNPDRKTSLGPETLGML